MAATDQEVFDEYAPRRLKVLTEGQISGLNGIVLGVGKRKKIKGACLLAEIPFYTVQVENPRATLAVLKVIKEHFKLNLNLAPMIERSKFIEEEVDKLVSYLKGEQQGASGPSPLSEDDIDKIKKDLAAYSKLPQSAAESIEKMFKEAQADITRAGKLKAELDRWNVYKEYEDRFLDLFRKKDDKGNIQQ
jgi:uncharacterized protein